MLKALLQKRGALFVSINRPIFDSTLLDTHHPFSICQTIILTYQATLDFLYQQLPAFSRIGPAAYKGSLDNTIALCQVLQHPERKFKSIHVAGTNGKGSVSHMLAAIFQKAGYKTGLYTSPHLYDFRERFRINGAMIPEQYVVDFVARIKEQLPIIQPSFFEITVALAFDWFAQEKVDIAIIETGLGGRLDSTNVIVPELSVITNIGWDHSNLLGDTLEKIAGEKAGIIKPGVPVVLGEVIPETESIFKNVANNNNSTLKIASRERMASDWRWEHGYLVVDISHAHHTDHQHYRLDLPGIYQLHNLLTVLECCTQMRMQGWLLPETTVQEALRSVKQLTGLAGRWEKIRSRPDIILEVAHNEPGIRQLLEQIELISYQQLHIVMGMVNDKDPQPVLKLLPANAQYYFSQASIPRAMPAETLQQQAADCGLVGVAYSNVNLALQAAEAAASPEDLIIVCGSIFLVAEVNRSGHA